MNRRPAVFLDRDGTLHRERGFVRRPIDLDVFPGVVQALRRLRGAGFALVVLTNQSGVARGLYDEAMLARVHEELHERLQRLPRAYLHCPHLPEAAGPYGGECGCRKPAPGLLHTACELFDLRLRGSFVVGDSARDLLMARGLPVGKVLVRSGKPWEEELARLEEAGVGPVHVADDLAAAAAWIVARSHLTA